MLQMCWELQIKVFYFMLLLIELSHSVLSIVIL